MKNQKISFSSSIFLSISSIIGAGIFLKAQKLNSLSNHYSTPIIFLFFLSLIAIITLSYSLIKIIPIQKTNSGFIEWTEKLTYRWFNKLSVNFVRNIYHPVSLLLFSAYSIHNISGNTKLNSISILVLGFLICLLFMTVNLISFDISKKVQIFLICLVFIPLIILPALGFINPGTKDTSQEISNSNSASWLVLISGLPSILFIFDGFYSLNTIKQKLEKPQYLTKSLIISFAIVTLLYLYVIIGFNIGDPKSANYKNFPIIQSNPKLGVFFEMLIGCASFLTLNSIVLGNVFQLSSINKKYKFKDINWLQKKLFYKSLGNENKEFKQYFISWIYLMIKTLGLFVVVGIITHISNIVGEQNFLISILDSWTETVSVLVFSIIAVVILASINKFQFLNKENIYFKFSTIFSSTFIFITLLYLVISYIVGIFDVHSKEHISSIFKFLFLLLFFLISSWDQILKFTKRFINKKKYLLLSTNIKDSIITLE